MIIRSVSMTAAVASQVLFLAGLRGNAGHASEKTPIIYSTDLFQPHDDPDDHFDLATLFAIDQFEILGIVLDDGGKQLQRPGRIPLAQLMHLTGRKVPYAIGLKPPLRSTKDNGSSQPEVFQEGVELILDALRNSPRKVTIFTTGSLRDVAAAFNRDPQLLRDKVARLYINIGNVAAEKNEWNVTLDERAYACILQSDLPVFWCPCFGEHYGTFWRFQQQKVLAAAPAAVQNFFIFALATGRGWEGPIPIGIYDPIPYLSRPVDEVTLQTVGRITRAMWCTAPFFHAAGYEVIQDESHHWAALPEPMNMDSRISVYGFVPARVRTYQQGLATVEEISPVEQSNLRIFKVLDRDKYEMVMTSCLRELLGHRHLASRQNPSGTPAVR